MSKQSKSGQEPEPPNQSTGHSQAPAKYPSDQSTDSKSDKKKTDRRTNGQTLAGAEQEIELILV